MTTEEKFWDAVSYVSSLGDPRAKLVAGQAALVGSLREGLKERDAQLDALHASHDRVTAGLEAAAAALHAAQKAVQAAFPTDPYATAGRMNGGHENVMAYVHGDPEYLTRGGLSTRHIDSRPDRGGAKKKTSKEAEHG